MKKKVLKLLKDMQGQLESEKAKEEEVYAKLSCWCEVNGKEKDAAVDAALRKTAEQEDYVCFDSKLECIFSNFDFFILSNFF